MILEIRTYRLKPGTRADFLQIMHEEALPLLAKAGIDVVSSGASLVDEDGHEGGVPHPRVPLETDPRRAGGRLLHQPGMAPGPA
ncbi:hypothetical protein ACIBK9_00485 [Nonomuraea sp. NPDC050227]|uniref:hypothetical protein n=1 Tax=Nonomuraea sp. NPDC050227 TaxID=3364360 RepID=UPI0037A4C7AD